MFEGIRLDNGHPTDNLLDNPTEVEHIGILMCQLHEYWISLSFPQVYLSFFFNRLGLLVNSIACGIGYTFFHIMIHINNPLGKFTCCYICSLEIFVLTLVIIVSMFYM